VDHPEIRSLFTRESLLASDWYRERLQMKQTRDVALWRRHLRALEDFARSGRALPAQVPAQNGSELASRLALARAQLARVSSPGYLGELLGTIGADPFHKQIPAAHTA
jgi:hypothetical protein